MDRPLPLPDAPGDRTVAMADDFKRSSIGEALRDRRAYHGWTLADVSARTGISRGTLSKLENDLISPSYQTILQLCAGLGVEITDLMDLNGLSSDNGRFTGRRSISYQHAGLTMGDENFSYTYLCADIAHKRIVPMFVEVRAHSMREIDGLWSHVGEEYLYVIKGSVVLHTELYEPTTLSQGDSVYFDSTMGHAYLAAGDEPAHLLVMCSSATPNLAQTLREMLSERLTKATKRKK